MAMVSERANMWTVVGSVATSVSVALAIFWGVLTLTDDPLKEHINDLQKQVDAINVRMTPLLTLYAQHDADEEKFAAINKKMDEKLDRNVHDVFAELTSNRVTALVDTNNNALAEISHQVHDLEGKIVSREENVVHWTLTDALTLRVNQLSDRLSEHLNSGSNTNAPNQKHE